jgi:hypothetical protein
MKKLIAQIIVTIAVIAILCVFALTNTATSPLIAMATVLTNAGKAITTNRIIGAGTEPTFVAWGTGAGTAAVADTTLFTEASESRVSGTSSRVTTSVTNDTYQVVGTLTANAGKTITNAGNFDASSGGNLYVKGDFTGIALNTGDAIQFTIKCQYT